MKLLQRFDWLKGKVPATRESRTFDYSASKRGWGHDIGFQVIDGGMKLRAHGWGPRPAGVDETKREWMDAGDFVIISQTGGAETTRYRIDAIKYEMNPRDMWFADLSFAPREACPTKAEAER